MAYAVPPPGSCCCTVHSVEGPARYTMVCANCRTMPQATASGIHPGRANTTMQACR